MINICCCHESLLDGQDLSNSYVHQVCEDERTKRVFDGNCVRCGQHYGAVDDDDGKDYLDCHDCWMNEKDYKGYEGPGQ